MKKRILSLLLALAMVFGLAATGYAAASETPEPGAPEVEVTSTILGLANTNNKSTLKDEAIYLVAAAGPGDQAIYWYDENGNIQKSEEENFTLQGDTVTYQGEAVISLAGAQISTANARIKLLDSNTTHADEMILDQSKVSLTTENGQAVLRLSEGALEWNNWDYYDAVEDPDANSGREWSMMGGDGAGLYEFIFQVSGLTAGGKALDPVNVRAYVWIYGRDSSDLALSTEFVENTVDESYAVAVTPTDEAQWTWDTEGAESKAAKQPYMNDTATDYFTLTWPAGTDASGITAADVTVTLRSRFGDEYVLSEETAYGEHEYAVLASEAQTVVAVTYQQWAYIPVYNTLEVSVTKDGETVSKTWEVSSVGTFGVQTGGGGETVDNTVVVQNYTGLTGLTLQNAANTKGTLTTVIDGATYYYVEDENGVGSLAQGTVTGSGWLATVTLPENVYEMDVTDLYHVAVNGNCLYYYTPAEAPTVTKTLNVNGAEQEVVFTVSFSAARTTAEMLAGGAALEPGYNTYNTGADKFAWTGRYQAGWIPAINTTKPTTTPYASENGLLANYPFGFAAGTEQAEQPYYEAGLLPASSNGPGGPGAGGPGAGGPGAGGPGAGGPNEVDVSGEYVNDSGWTLYLNQNDTYLMVNGNTVMTGTYKTQSKFNFFTKQTTTIVILNEAGAKALAEAGGLPAWYVYITPNQENGTYSVSKDVSLGLIDKAANLDDYAIVTVANPGSPTGYTTTITVKDRGYGSVYAYGDWESVWSDQEPAEDGISYDVTYGPDEWENGMNYASSSVLPLVRNAGGDWEITLNLASSVMGVIAYHDIAEEDLVALFPQKISFYVPYDEEKQSDSFDWTLAFPADAGKAGSVDSTVVTEDGLTLSVYTPAGYDPSGAKYPVLYLIPGGGSNYMSWFNDGMINNIFDNAIAEGAVLPTIVVSMEREPVTTMNDPDLENIVKIVEYIEANYNTYTDAAHRALGGVSMGSVAATDIWLAHPDLFGYWIFLSGADKQVFSAGEGDYSGIVGQLKAGNYYTGGGTIDFNMYDGDQSSASVVELNAWLEKYGVEYETGLSVGVHNWPIWTQLMISYVPELLWDGVEKTAQPGVDAPGADAPGTADPSVPETGDSMSIVFWSIVLLVCAAAAVIVAGKCRQRNV